MISVSENRLHNAELAAPACVLNPMEADPQKCPVCTYCGDASPTTMDHIPPKCLFAKPRPALITVPCCLRCNREASKDDEYLRLMLISKHDAGDHPEARKLWSATQRSLERAPRSRFTQAFLESVMRIDMKSLGGIYLGSRPGYNVDLRRLDHVAGRVVKGLFFHHRRYRLPNEYEVVVYSEDGLRDAGEDGIRSLQAMVAVAKSEPPKVIGADVFKYWFVAAKDAQDATFWVLSFFDAVSFVCLTAPQDRLAAIRAGGTPNP